jgi:hypothetical protein
MKENTLGITLPTYMTTPPAPEFTKQEISELTEFDSEEPVGKPVSKKK